MSESTSDDVLRGDPARHVLGREEEKPARVHAPQKPKPKRPTPDGLRILRDIQRRMAELRPLVDEGARLKEADAKLAEVDKKFRPPNRRGGKKKKAKA